jgi:hypothetical protein
LVKKVAPAVVSLTVKARAAKQDPIIIILYFGGFRMLLELPPIERSTAPA